MSMIQRWKHPSIRLHLWGLVQGFAEIADGIVTLGSLGFFLSGFELEVARRRAKLNLLQQMKQWSLR